ncbi:PREDICTED: protein DOWNY MILDEW RESISTANCE 6 [Nelumbo nucifera]|uniref:Protein DOWNY MILDEW RESISTANCE 6 n=2 Tax=Nelumbo nucifera TaxID=4432 RepID=A0A1U7ZCP9_NELNU|nr:PREDICTED: protein DOWNY MILDEW RESISTANCE 6 [Nelumbo nucifera]DAD36100.1 TPA_asm: hypothetical protein HUJ06_006740 [Nelumbo nucifera]
MEPKFLSTGFQYSTLPENYVRPESERPRLSQVTNCPDIPVVDLACVDRCRISQQIGNACRCFGFFQVINHGIPVESTMRMLEMAKEFFHMSVEEKMKYYSDDPSKTLRLSTSFNVKKETVRNWRDYLRLHCYPLDKYVHEWPSHPSSFKDVVSRYSKEVRQLGFRLLEYISESLGLEEEYMEKVLGEQGQHMAINYYQPCPQPELTYGLPAHTDPNAITILLQDEQVAGLQVFKDGNWFAVNPQPDTFIINIGDQLQALSNGQYRSVWHRTVVNTEKPRISVASFLCPANHAVITPAEGLTEDGTPAMYKSFTYEEYYQKFWSRNLDQQHCLELFKNN